MTSPLVGEVKELNFHANFNGTALSGAPAPIDLESGFQAIMVSLFNRA